MFSRLPPDTLADRSWRLRARHWAHYAGARLWATTAVLLALTILTWAGASAREIVENGRTPVGPLDPATLTSTSSAISSQVALLLPVLVLFSLVLGFLPRGNGPVLRAAEAGALVLGWFTPDPALLEPFPHGPSHLPGAGLPPAVADSYLVSCVVASFTAFALVLAAHAARVTAGYRWPNPLSASGIAPSLTRPISRVRRTTAVPLVLTVLLASSWVAVVLPTLVLEMPVEGPSAVREAASHQSGLLVPLSAAAVAVCASPSYHRPHRLAAAVAAVIGYTWAHHVHDIALPPLVPGSTDVFLTMGRLWGEHAPLAALVVYLPAALLGGYLIAALLRWR